LADSRSEASGLEYIKCRTEAVGIVGEARVSLLGEQAAEAAGSARRCRRRRGAGPAGLEATGVRGVPGQDRGRPLDERETFRLRKTVAASAVRRQLGTLAVPRKRALSRNKKPNTGVCDAGAPPSASRRRLPKLGPRRLEGGRPSTRHPRWSLPITRGPVTSPVTGNVAASGEPTPPVYQSLRCLVGGRSTLRTGAPVALRERGRRPPRTLAASSDRGTLDKQPNVSIQSWAPNLARESGQDSVTIGCNALLGKGGSG